MRIWWGAGQAAAALLLLVTGCADGGGLVEQEQAEAERPPIEQEQERLTRLRDQLRDRLGTDLQLRGWTVMDDRLSSGCTELPDDAATRVFLPSLLLDGGVDDATWPQAVRVVQEVAAVEGFGAAEVVVDRPREHEVVLRGRWGSLLRFGTLQNATLALHTGCHLPGGTS